MIPEPITLTTVVDIFLLLLTRNCCSPPARLLPSC